MNVVVTDTNIVPDTGPISGKEIMFAMVQQSPVAAQIILRNAGANQINYTFQEQIAGVWTDMDSVGTPLNNTLASGSTGIVLLTVESSEANVRLIANASGGSTIEFLITRFYPRSTGGNVPLLSLG